ncbi:hypothetical protein DFS33DRAFT_1476012 [Desarmillaria ectypa]|nr:hypothetical protein DFS33DRAFT_1476012 [Desarmillaria ectypa]
MDTIYVSAITLCVYLVALSLEYALRRKHLRKQTCVLDLDGLGLRLPGKKIKGTSVICGGRILGLLAARVCHDHFEEVVIVELESWLNSENARQMHSGTEKVSVRSETEFSPPKSDFQQEETCLKKLFQLCEPFQSNFLWADIIRGPRETRMYLWGNALKRQHAEYGSSLHKTIYASRAGLETCFRRLVFGGKCKNIRQIIGTVTGVSRSASNPNPLDAVTVRIPEGSNSINAALVIDCMTCICGPKMAPKGRIQTRCLKIAYDQKLQYMTLQFRIAPEVARRLPGLLALFDECGIIYCLATDPDKEARGLYTNRVEISVEFQLCFSTMGECELSTNLDAAKACNRSLLIQKPIPRSFFALLDALEEVLDTMTCSKVYFIGSSYIWYEKGVNLPSNWVALDDSVMRVNPIYGHGFTNAFFGAICLSVLLQKLTEIHEKFANLLFRMQANKNKPLWSGTKVGGANSS